MIKRILSGVLMSVLVAGTAMGASAAPASASEPLPVLHADVDAWQVTLQDGHRSSDKDQSGSLSLKGSVDEGSTDDVLTLRGPSSRPHSRYLYGETEYRIVMLGKPTAFWVKASLFTDGSYAAKCGVYFGEPSKGGEVLDQMPFTCWTRLTTEKPDYRYTFHIGLNRDAEASGAISPTGDVSLGKGVYNAFGLPYAVHGTDSVASGSTTTFDTVLRVGDKNPYENQARTEFAYQIYDRGVPTDYWVAGLSTNYRGSTRFSGDGHCGIYESNPLADLGELDQSVPLKGTPYTCTADGYYEGGPHDDGRGHFFAQFTVSAGK